MIKRERDTEIVLRNELECMSCSHDVYSAMRMSILEQARAVSKGAVPETLPLSGIFGLSKAGRDLVSCIRGKIAPGRGKWGTVDGCVDSKPECVGMHRGKQRGKEEEEEERM